MVSSQKRDLKHDHHRIVLDVVLMNQGNWQTKQTFSDDVMCVHTHKRCRFLFLSFFRFSSSARLVCFC